MRTTYALPGARGLGASLLLALVLVCIPGTCVVGGSVARAAEADSPPLAIWTGYGRSDGSPEIRTLQRQLRVLGQDPGPVDGLYGPLTEAAVERFQLAAAVQVDGVVGPQTRRALRAATPPALARGTGFGQPAGSDLVRRLQRRLRSLHHRPGPVDGLFGPRTEAAVVRFQRSEGLAANGQVGPRTRRALAGAEPVHEQPASDQTTPDKPRSTPGGESPTRAVQPVQATDSGGQEAGPPLLLAAALLTLALISVGTARALRRARPTGGSTMTASNEVGTGRTWPRFGTRQADGGRAAGGDLLRHWEANGGNGVAGAGLPPSWVEGNDESTSPHAAPARDADAPAPAAATDAAPVPASPTDTPPATAVRVLGYVTSTAEESAGAESAEQIEELDRYCEKRGWELTEVVRDVRAAGRRENPPGLDYALGRMEADEASCMIVAELRRLAVSAGELGRILRTLREREMRLIALDTALDTTSSEGQLAVDALIAVGELERERQSELNRNGLAAARAKGAMSGRPTVHDVPALKKHIQSMRSSGMTLKAIADRLNAEGVPTLRGGRQWRPSSVQVAAGYHRPPKAPRLERAYGSPTDWPRKAGG